MADVKQLTIDARVLKVLAVSHPDLILEAQNSITPLMNNLNMIGEIYAYVCLTYKPAEDYIHKLLFIASILRLFNPDALLIECKLRNGIRSSLASCFDDSGTNTSHYIGQARAYMKIKTFKSSVDSITEQYLNQVNCA
ncbi:hypothetical protein HDE69_002659 [Pedobacter cryoconitis]|uniref:Uncharacterized protein n=1 Tax=Pedobacter cryoconitis TaxID=188932 RepID=A0A7W8YU22_9SPHI|nr:hypothetical protein [Pedobacter cryoconitis]MBB5621598.1 hypothetical protein [Pedobacter cryoconitis]